VQQLQPLRIKLGRHLGEPGRVAARSGQRRDKALFDGIVDLDKDDRDRARGCLQGGCLLPADAGDDRRRQRHQLAGQAAEPLRLAHGVARTSIKMVCPSM
jgi:hypothetical protein